jgi:hypothetical protein
MSAISNSSSTIPGRVFTAALVVLLAAVAVAVGSIDAYLIEDHNAAATAAYQAFPLIRLTYSGMYISTMTVFVLTVVIAIRIAFARLAATNMPSTRILVVAIATFTALAAFWGLALRQLLNFLVVIAVFAAWLFIVTIAGSSIVHGAIKQHSFPASEQSTPLLTACAGALFAMLINLILAITHTVLVKANSPDLYRDTITTIAGYTISESVLLNIIAALLTILASIFVARTVISLRYRP